MYVCIHIYICVCVCATNKTTVRLSKHSKRTVSQASDDVLERGCTIQRWGRCNEGAVKVSRVLRGRDVEKVLCHEERDGKVRASKERRHHINYRNRTPFNIFFIRLLCISVVHNPP